MSLPSWAALAISGLQKVLISSHLGAKDSSTIMAVSFLTQNDYSEMQSSVHSWGQCQPNDVGINTNDRIAACKLLIRVRSQFSFSALRECSVYTSSVGVAVHRLAITAFVNVVVVPWPPISAVFSSNEPSLIALKTALTILQNIQGSRKGWPVVWQLCANFLTELDSLV